MTHFERDHSSSVGKYATLTSKGGWKILSVFLSASMLWAGSPSDAQNASWSPKAAAAYLDRRQGWWMAWPPAKLDQGTTCVSCHTALAYAIARPVLRTELGEKSPSENERKLLESVSKRVRLWKDVRPFYGGDKTLQSRGTESVLNALIEVNVDARSGQLSDETRSALGNMWALQNKTGDQKGAWPWLNFGNQPFEAYESVFYGASLAAVAVSTAPNNYSRDPEIQENLKLLEDYLRREFDRQPLIHQVVALWASTKLPELFSPAQRKTILENVLASQQSDGGWGLSSVGWAWRGSTLRSIINLWIRSNDMPLTGKSDGYATGLIVFVLRQAGVPREDIHMRRGRSWLVSNQDRIEGLWPGYSMVNRRDPSSGTGLFMSDAATAYAVLALNSW